MQSRPGQAKRFRSYVPSANPVDSGFRSPFAWLRSPLAPQERRDREPNSVFADRRAKLAGANRIPNHPVGPDWTRRIFANLYF